MLSTFSTYTLDAEAIFVDSERLLYVIMGEGKRLKFRRLQ